MLLNVCSKPKTLADIKVAGHLFEEGKAGSLVDDRGHFYKPIQPGPRGDRERAFYESILAAKSRDKAAWNRGEWSPAAIAAVQAIASGQQIAQVLGLDQNLPRASTVTTAAAHGSGSSNSPTSPSTSYLAPIHGQASGSPRFTPSFPFPSSPTFQRPSSSAMATTGQSRGMKQFPTFRAEPSFRQHHGGMNAIIRDPIEVLERDEVGLIDQLVEEEWLPWSEDEHEGDDLINEPPLRNGRLGNDDATTIIEEGIPIPLVRTASHPNGNGLSYQQHDHDHTNHHDEDDDLKLNDEDGSLRYSRSPDSASDDGLESNTGQHVMDGVVVAHSNSLRNQHSGRRSSIELMEAAHRDRRASADLAAQNGHTTTTIDTVSNTMNTSSTAAARIAKFVGNTPTRPLGSHRNSIGGGLSHKSTDSIDEALRLHALSLNTTPKISQPPILEEKVKEEAEDEKKHALVSSLSGSSALGGVPWREMPFTVRNAPLLRVIPKFYGVTHADERTLLELEDLARWYRHPCIMDIKIGYKTWYTHAEPDYIERCKRKDAATTQSLLGFKICGMQVYRHARGGYWRASKRWCKTLPEALVDKALASFANNEHGLRPSDVYGGDQGVVAQLKALESWFQVQTEFHLYSASLLLLYEGDARGAEETNVRVRLVDFAHTFALGSGGGATKDGNSDTEGEEEQQQKKRDRNDIDENFLGGLRAIASRLNAVSTMEYVADTLMTTAPA